MKKTILILLVLASSLNLSSENPSVTSPKRAFSVWFDLGAQYLGSHGSNDDYEEGVNDFPVTPAHMAPYFRVLAGYRILPRTDLLADLTWYSNQNVTKKDPSDGDEIRIRSAARTAMAILVHHYWHEGTLSHYLEFGLGLDRSKGAAVNLITKLGYRYISDPVKPETDLFAVGGIGTQLRFDDTIYAFSDLRLLGIFDGGFPQLGISTSIGVLLRF